MSHTLKFETKEHGIVHIHYNGDGSGDVNVLWKDDPEKNANDVSLPAEVFWGAAHHFFGSQFTNRAIEKIEELGDELYGEVPQSPQGYGG